jgi:hypothetical protein
VANICVRVINERGVKQKEIQLGEEEYELSWGTSSDYWGWVSKRELALLVRAGGFQRLHFSGYLNPGSLPGALGASRR